MAYANVKRFMLTRVPLTLQNVEFTLLTLPHLKLGYFALRLAFTTTLPDASTTSL